MILQVFASILKCLSMCKCKPLETSVDRTQVSDDRLHLVYALFIHSTVAVVYLILNKVYIIIIYYHIIVF